MHRQLRHDPNWVCLDDATKGHLLAIWILAADKNGEIPDDPNLIRKLCHLDNPPDIKLLTEMGFLDATEAPRRRHRSKQATPARRQSDVLEAESESEAESERKRGFQLPNGWQPSEETISVLEGEGFSSFFLKQSLRDMVEWAAANGHRAIARKSNWDAAFRSWCRRSKGQGDTTRSAAEVAIQELSSGKPESGGLRLRGPSDGGADC